MTKSKSSGWSSFKKISFCILCCCCVLLKISMVYLYLSKDHPSLIGYPVHLIGGDCDNWMYKEIMQQKYEEDKIKNKYLNPAYCNGFIDIN